MVSTADVVVIGAGITGSSAAFQLAQRGLKVALVEKRFVAAGSTGKILNQLFARALAVGKRTRTETAIGALAVSVPYAAVELARKVLHNMTCLHGYTWDMPNIMRGDRDTGEQQYEKPDQHEESERFIKRHRHAPATR